MCKHEGWDRPPTEEEIAFKNKQESQIEPDLELTCLCGTVSPLVDMYRCFFCGIWLCYNCAKEHFGDNKIGEET
jgi:hypothetical protein